MLLQIKLIFFFSIWHGELLDLHVHISTWLSSGNIHVISIHLLYVWFCPCMLIKTPLNKVISCVKLYYSRGSPTKYNQSMYRDIFVIIKYRISLYILWMFCLHRISCSRTDSANFICESSTSTTGYRPVFHRGL